MKIEKNIPIPAHGHNNRHDKYGFGAFEIGDSIFVADKIHSIISSAHQYGRRNNKKFVIRTVIENGVKGVRIWFAGYREQEGK